MGLKRGTVLTSEMYLLILSTNWFVVLIEGIDIFVSESDGKNGGGIIQHINPSAQSWHHTLSFILTRPKFHPTAEKSVSSSHMINVP
jgi:hypothetical protein